MIVYYGIFLLYFQAEYYSSVCITGKPHFIFSVICPWTFGMLQLLGILNNASLYRHVRISLRSSYNSFGYTSIIYAEVGLLDHKVFLFLILCRTSILFFIMAVLFYMPTNSAWGSNFTSLPTIIFCSFDSGHPNRCEMIYHCALP